MKKFIKWFAIVFVVIFAFLLAAPFIFKGKIVSLIKEEANKNLNAKIDFGDFDLSLIRSFPNFSLGINNLSIINLAPFEGDTLIYAGRLNLTIDLMSVIRGGEIGIRTVDLQNPVMNFLVDKEGKANWDIAKESETPATTSEPSTFKAKLKHYSLSNGRIVYHDESLAFYLRLAVVDHSGSGDFTQDVFDLVTKTNASSARMVYENIPYISDARTEIDAKLNIDMANFKFSFIENKILLNALEIGVNGWVAMPDTNIDMQIDFNAAKSEFKNFISMIPAIYQKDFDDLKSSGTMAFSGFIKGRYNAVSMPGFGLTLKIDDGSFQYPSLPSSVNGVFVDLDIQNPDGVDDHTVIDLRKLQLVMAGNPFEARLHLQTPVSDPNVDAYVKGKIDLSGIQALVPLEEGTKLSGLITADLKAKGRMSSIEQKKYDQFDASGNLLMKSIEYSAKDLSMPLSLSVMDLSFNPRHVSLNSFSATSGKSDFKANGTLDNFLAYALKNETLKGNLNLQSGKIDLNEWMGDEQGTSDAVDTSAMTVLDVPANIDFNLNASIGTLLYDNLVIESVKGNLLVRDRMINMQNLSMQVIGGSVRMSGKYSSADLKKPFFDMQLNLQNFDIPKTVNTFSTVEKLAPIAKSCAGSFSATLSINGILDQQMSPVLNTLNGGGKLNTSQITISNFPAFNKVADVLKMSSWKSVNLAPMNPSFNILDGRVFVDPVDVKFNGKKGTVAGSNGLDQTIDYTMAMEIPRAMFGGAANAVLDNLVSSANAKGARFSVGEIIPVNLLIGGTVSDPKVSSDLGKQGANVMDDLKAKAKEELDKQKAELEAKAREEADRLKSEAASRIEAEKQKAAQEADRIKKEAEAKAKATADSLKKAAEEEAKKKAKDALKNINPLKK